MRQTSQIISELNLFRKLIRKTTISLHVQVTSLAQNRRSPDAGDAGDAGCPGNPSVILNVFGVWCDNVCRSREEIVRDSAPGRAGRVLHYSLHSQTLNVQIQEMSARNFHSPQCVNNNMRFTRRGKKFSCGFK